MVREFIGNAKDKIDDKIGAKGSFKRIIVTGVAKNRIKNAIKKNKPLAKVSAAVETVDDHIFEYIDYIKSLVAGIENMHDQVCFLSGLLASPLTNLSDLTDDNYVTALSNTGAAIAEIGKPLVIPLDNRISMASAAMIEMIQGGENIEQMHTSQILERAYNNNDMGTNNNDMGTNKKVLFLKKFF